MRKTNTDVILVLVMQFNHTLTSSPLSHLRQDDRSLKPLPAWLMSKLKLEGYIFLARSKAIRYN